MLLKKYLFAFSLLLIGSCSINNPINETAIPIPPSKSVVSNFWKNATIYFLLTDRFYNGDKKNDSPFNRKKDGAVLRNFEGGDLKGITLKIKEGYFDKLGVNAIWMTPIIEQIHGSTDEGTGKTYAYHGYWAKDWTRLDPNFGTEADFAELIETAHQHGIRILMDVVVNHTGPVTEIDQQWPDSWVRTGPTCQYKDFASTVSCTLVENLPDIKTGSDSAVDLPPFLKEKWTTEGRLAQEEKSLDAFFQKTGYPRAPRFYLIKWFRDWVRKYGIDGFRIDTAKHTEAGIWQELKEECRTAFHEWKRDNPSKVLDEEDFYMVGEVYNYGVDTERNFDYGDQQVDFFANGFESLINFAFKYDAKNSYESLFSKYSQALNSNTMQSVSVVNYLTSHDDGTPFDGERLKAFETGTKLLLSPGAAQIYYGDEIARPLIIEGTQGDATLRSFMNWEDLNQKSTRDLLTHWQKLGQFRNAHPAIGAGVHPQIQASPYLFKRTLAANNQQDEVLIGLDLKKGQKNIPVSAVFENGSKVKDFYSGKMATVKDGAIQLDTHFEIILVEAVN
mgnify:CR=1 FL=1|jgi:alpha-amylase